MILSTLGLKLDGMITEMVRTQRQSYDGVIAPVEDCSGSYLPSNKCDAEVILVAQQAATINARMHHTSDTVIQNCQ